MASVRSPGCPLGTAGSAPEAPVEQDVARRREVPLALNPESLTRSTSKVPELFVKDPYVMAREDVLVYGQSLGREASLEEASQRRFPRAGQAAEEERSRPFE